MEEEAEGRPTCRLVRVFRHATGDDGVTLVELMLAVTILAVALAGFLTSVVSGLALSNNNTYRAIAANVLDERMAALRAMDFADIPQGLTEDSVQRGAREISVRQEASLVSQSATGSACDAPSTGESPAYLRVTLEARWTTMQGVTPVTSETIINPPVAAYDPYKGHAAVKVIDRAGVPRSGVMVNISPVSGGAVATPPVMATSSDGCVFFPNLEPGTYEVWLDEEGNVDRESGLEDTSEAVPANEVTVTPSTTQALEFSYDEAATLVMTEPGLGALPESPVAVNIANPNFGAVPGAPQRFTDAAALADTPLFPFASGWSVFAGCDEHDPLDFDPPDSRLNLPTDPGQTTNEQLPLARYRVTVVDKDGASVPDAEVELVGTCDGAAQTLTYDAATDAAGGVDLLAPFGTWQLQVTGMEAESVWPEVTAAPADEFVDVTVEVDE